MRISDWSSDVCSSDLQKRLGLRAIAILAWCRMDPKRQTDRIDGGVQLGRQAAARTTDGGTFSPPFAPLASAWTFEIVLSLITYSKSGVSAMAWKSPSHTPLRDHRRSEEHTSELQSLMRNSYAVFCL